MDIYDGQIKFTLNDDIKDRDGFKDHVSGELRKKKTHTISKNGEEASFERKVFFDSPASLQFVRTLRIKYWERSARPELLVSFTTTAFPYLVHLLLVIACIAMLFSNEYFIGLALLAIQPIAFWIIEGYLQGSVRSFFREVERSFLRLNDPFCGTKGKRSH